jgi:hypothetical protein
MRGQNGKVSADKNHPGSLARASRNMKRGAPVLLFVVVWVGTAWVCKAQGHADVAQSILDEHRESIVRAAREFHQEPRILASVIFAERALNVRPAKSLAEGLAAKIGYNASLGVAQIKVQTATWIEKHLGDLCGAFSPSDETKERLAPSMMRGALIDRLEEPFTNLLYAAAYLALITKMWAEILNAPELQGSRVGIIATLYSLGLQLPDGSLRAPHRHPRMNHFGEVAQTFYDGFILQEVFPK